MKPTMAGVQQNFNCQNQPQDYNANRNFKHFAF